MPGHHVDLVDLHLALQRHLRGLGGQAAAQGISQARSRLGEAPLHRLYETVVQPIATRASKGAWYRAWRLVSLDGSCLDVADTEENRTEFGCPGASCGESAFPQLRFVALVENGTHVLFGARLGRYAEGETTLAHDVVPALRPSMLCLADRQFFGHALWQATSATGADLLWRGKHNLRLPREAVLADGSYLTTIYPGDKDRRHRTGGVRGRVIEYRLEGLAEAEPLYRLVTTILDPAQAPAAELAALYPQNRTLLAFFEGVAQPPNADPVQTARWLRELVGWLMTEKAAGILDMGGGDTSLAALIDNTPVVASEMEEAGVAPVAAYLLGPRVDDLASLETFERRGFKPKATAIILNEGRVDAGMEREEAFARVLRHSAVKRALDRGAVQVWLPRLDPPELAQEIEAKRLAFGLARDGLVPAGKTFPPIGGLNRAAVRRWLERMEAEFVPVRSWLP